MAEVAEKSQTLENGLRNLAESSSLITEVRGQGMLWGIVTTIPAADVVQAAQKHNLLILVAGTNVVRLIPPLTISTDETNLLLEKLAATFTDCEAAAEQAQTTK